MAVFPSFLLPHGHAPELLLVVLVLVAWVQWKTYPEYAFPWSQRQLPSELQLVGLLSSSAPSVYAWLVVVVVPDVVPELLPSTVFVP